MNTNDWPYFGGGQPAVLKREDFPRYMDIAGRKSARRGSATLLLQDRKDFSPDAVECGCLRIPICPSFAQLIPALICGLRRHEYPIRSSVSSPIRSRCMRGWNYRWGGAFRGRYARPGALGR